MTKTSTFFKTSLQSKIYLPENKSTVFKYTTSFFLSVHLCDWFCENTSLVHSLTCSGQLFPNSSIIRLRVICRLPPWVLYNSLFLSALIWQIRINDLSTQCLARDLLYNMEALGDSERYNFLQTTITCAGITHHSIHVISPFCQL